MKWISKKQGNSVMTESKYDDMLIPSDITLLVKRLDRAIYDFRDEVTPDSINHIANTASTAAKVLTKLNDELGKTKEALTRTRQSWNKLDEIANDWADRAHISEDRVKGLEIENSQLLEKIKQLKEALSGLLKAYENAFDWTTELPPETIEAEEIANKVLQTISKIPEVPDERERTKSDAFSMKVKELEWVDGEAKTVFGNTYKVYRRADGMYEAMGSGEFLNGPYADMETAKAAVQDYYERLVRSILQFEKKINYFDTIENVELPTIHAMFETVDPSVPVIGTTAAPVKRIMQNDDGSYTVVIDHWPQPKTY